MTDDRPAPASDNRPSYVVGIGASAGGLEALERFFDNLPTDTGMAFVVVQHLSPDFKSLMDELLARHTNLPIQLVEDGMVVSPDHVYLIPPKKEMIISGGRLLLSERDRQQELTLPIDVFFRSLAQDQGERAIAIVLSGGGSDGSRGIRAIHDAGGLVMIQDVESAQFDGMPKTARQAGVASWVLRPEEMPSILLRHHRDRSERSPSQVDRGEAAPLESGSLDVVYGMLEGEYGIDFTHYKPSTVTRRIERRLKLARDEDLRAYVQRLKGEREELDVLYRDLLIGVTRFFRNEEAFALLEDKIIPELFARGPRDVPLRVWVAGCATGEEAYSLAILLHEASLRFNRQVKIFATDVHRGSLEIAARGVYDEDAVINVSAARLERYFWRRARTFQIVPDLRSLIVFAPHNVIRDAPFTRVDLVTCRNLLIYLQPQAQQKVLGLFHFALNRGGVMFLGPSESPGALGADFETLDRHWRVYRKFSDVRIPFDPRARPRSSADLESPPSIPPATVRGTVPSLLGTYDRLLEEFMPPSLLVSERGELVHSFGGASKFLRIRDGRPALDIRDVVDEDLKLVLVGGLSRAIKSEQAIAFKGVRLGTNDGQGVFDVVIRRFRSKTAGALHLLVSFTQVDAGKERLPDHETEVDLGQVSKDQVVILENELTSTKENLQAAIEELETSNEELQAANEELLASNEELQATNEELQSVNEELYTVNAEYQRKITELTELTNDMDNLLASTDVGTIFLDRDLQIRKFTPQIAESFKLLPQDIGRPLASFSSELEHPELGAEIRAVLESGRVVERELRDRRGRAFFLRILPYRAKGTIDGVVLTLIEISGLRAAEDALFHERHLLNSLLFSSRDAIYFKDIAGRFIRANAAMAKRLGAPDPNDIVGKTAFELARHDAAAQEQDEAVLRTGLAQHDRVERRKVAGGATEWDVVSRLPLRDPSSEIVGVIGIFRNITEQKRAEEKIQEAVRRRDQFLAMLSHELRNPLGAIVTATSLLLDGKTPESGRLKLLRILERQSAQMARLLEDLLEASRVTQNKIELRKRIVDLGRIARDAADAARSVIGARGHTFDVTIDPRPLFVDGDPTRLQQIQVNLLSNAAKYTPENGRVTLEVGRDESNAFIRVKDDGVGIARGMLDNVFELFVQSNRTLDRAEGGIGVGLTLVRSLVGMHGGTVEAKSEGEGKGSEFVVRLPLAMPERASSALVTRVDRPFVAPPNARIVIVEDNVDSCQMLCELLGLVGFVCESANDGAAGLELIRRTKPDVAIVDVGLPELDGFEVVRRLRADDAFAKLHLIALTGYGQSADRERALQAGFDEHLVKPIKPESLLAALGVPAKEGQDGDGQDGDGMHLDGASSGLRWPGHDGAPIGQRTSPKAGGPTN